MKARFLTIKFATPEIKDAKRVGNAVKQGASATQKYLRQKLGRSFYRLGNVVTPK